MDQVGIDRADRRPVLFHEDRVGGPARQGLDAGGATAREEVEEAGAREVRLEDREERLLDPVAERPGPLRRRPQPHAPGTPGDDPPGVSHRWVRRVRALQAARGLGGGDSPEPA